MVGCLCHFSSSCPLLWCQPWALPVPESCRESSWAWDSTGEGSVIVSAGCVCAGFSNQTNAISSCIYCKQSSGLRVRLSARPLDCAEIETPGGSCSPAGGDPGWVRSKATPAALKKICHSGKCEVFPQWDPSPLCWLELGLDTWLTSLLRCMRVVGNMSKTVYSVWDSFIQSSESGSLYQLWHREQQNVVLGTEANCKALLL